MSRSSRVNMLRKITFLLIVATTYAGYPEDPTSNSIDGSSDSYGYGYSGSFSGGAPPNIPIPNFDFSGLFNGYLAELSKYHAEFMRNGGGMDSYSHAQASSSISFNNGYSLQAQAANAVGGGGGGGAGYGSSGYGGSFSRSGPVGGGFAFSGGVPAGGGFGGGFSGSGPFGGGFSYPHNAILQAQAAQSANAAGGGGGAGYGSSGFGGSFSGSGPVGGGFAFSGGVPAGGGFGGGFSGSGPFGGGFSYPEGAPGASASASIGPGGGQLTAAVYPENPAIPNINTRFGESSQPGGFKSVSTFSSSHTANVNGVPKTVQQATSTINDNGKITTYTAKRP